jgi:precorrin-2/cobalt-factor-2 C20-methyltransferase
LKRGTLYGIGVGPGDPELITVKGANILSRCRHVFVPKARIASDSLALSIAARYLGCATKIYELVFPMTSDLDELSRRWRESAREIMTVLEKGEDACFLTLGDPLLYSTYIYLLREIRTIAADTNILTVPGVMALSAAAALAEFPIGEAKEPVMVIPTADDLEEVRLSLKKKGTVILMKIGKRLHDILDIMEDGGLIDQGVFVSHAGMANQRVETDLRTLRKEGAEVGYLSIILVHVVGPVNSDK